MICVIVVINVSNPLRVNKKFKFVLYYSIIWNSMFHEWFNLFAIVSHSISQSSRMIPVDDAKGALRVRSISSFGLMNAPGPDWTQERPSFLWIMEDVRRSGGEWTCKNPSVGFSFNANKGRFSSLLQTNDRLARKGNPSFRGIGFRSDGRVVFQNYICLIWIVDIISNGMERFNIGWYAIAGMIFVEFHGWGKRKDVGTFFSILQ